MRNCKLATLITAFALYALPASAAIATGNVAVSASVAKNCTVAGGAIAFGSYDPVNVNAAADLDGAGTVTVACNKGTAYAVALSAGANNSGTARRMVGAAAADFLTYEIFTTTGRTIIWNATNTLGGTALSKAPIAIPAFGRVVKNQDVSADTYTDTVVATITF